MTGGGDLAISRLAVRNAPAEGVLVEVPGGATGKVRVSLVDVDVTDNASFGVLVNDQVDPSPTDGVQPNQNGSAASIDVSVLNSRFIHNGYSVSDRDGLRVNEGGLGDLIITSTRPPPTTPATASKSTSAARATCASTCSGRWLRATAPSTATRG